MLGTECENQVINEVKKYKNKKMNKTLYKVKCYVYTEKVAVVHFKCILECGKQTRLLVAQG